MSRYSLSSPAKLTHSDLKPRQSLLMQNALSRGTTGRGTRKDAGARAAAAKNGSESQKRRSSTALSREIPSQEPRRSVVCIQLCRRRY